MLPQYSPARAKLSGWDRQNEAFSKQQKYIRGVFAGGTLCYQAQQIMRDGGLQVHSNAPIDKRLKLADPNISHEHSIVDMGAEVFTEGRPHPMIDAALRKERIQSEANDPEMAVLLLDFILGYNSSADPVGELVGVIKDAKQKARERGGYLSVVASVCGTDDDPQQLSKQIAMLEEISVVVSPNSAHAANFALKVQSRRMAL